MYRRPSIMLKEQSNDSWSDPLCQIQKESRGGQDNTVAHRRVEYSSMASLDSFGISGRTNETSVRFLLNCMPTKQRFESIVCSSIRPRGSSGYKVDIIYGPFGSIIHRLINDGIVVLGNMDCLSAAVVVNKVLPVINKMVCYHT